MIRWSIAGLLALGLATAGVSANAHDHRFEKLVAEAKATMLADPSSAVGKAQAAEQYAAHVGGSKARAVMVAEARWLRGEAYLRMGEWDTAQPLIRTALQAIISSEPNSDLHADILLTRANIHAEQGSVAAALSDLHLAHRIFQRNGATRSRAKALTQIASLYARGNDHPNALRYFDQAGELYDADPGLGLAIYNGRGNALKELRRFGEAEEQFQLALETAQSMNSSLLVATVLSNIIRARLETKQLDAADEAIAQGLGVTGRADAASYRPLMLALAAQSAFQRHNLPRAERLIAERFRGVDFARSTLPDRDAHEIAYKVYQATGQTALALQHLEVLRRLDEQATTLVRSNSAALLSARFDFANQELRIANLKADDLRKGITLERARAQSQRLLFFGGAGVTLLVILMLGVSLFTIRRSRDKVRAANIDLGFINTRLQKALAAKTEFLATTSHEIRTPLNGILGMTQVMLADPRIDGDTRDRIGVVHGAGTTMRSLVDDILDVAKMDTGNLTIEAVGYDLCRAVTDSARMWRDQAEAKGLAFDLALDDCPTRLVGDPTRLRQIVFNLLSNAVKFTPSGHVTLTVRNEGDRLRVIVADTGIGVAPARQEEIFEMFRQADAGTTRQFGGTGLGLSICRGLARAMQGDVTVESAEGDGATFTLDLPLVRETTPVPCDEAGSAAALVIDRNPITRAMFKSLLEPNAGCVVTAATVDEALSVLERCQPAIVLADDATLRAYGDPVAAVAVLSATGGSPSVSLLWSNDEADQRDSLLAAGAARVILRPVSRDALLRALFGTTPVSLVPQAA